ncbi:MAG: indole-3-glycerol phosphate synthase TrpC [Pyrinomonadaceae bacterium]
MSSTFLDKVTAEARERVAAARSYGYLPKLTRSAQAALANREKHAFRDSLKEQDRVNIIAEIKRSSPSKGVIRANVDVVQTAKLYAAGGACAISVLTEPEHFDGSISDLVTVAKAVEIPILRKDFIIDEYQIIEAAAAGASAILLIVAALDGEELSELHAVAESFGLDVLVEIRDADELQTAIEIGAKIIGVNNRNLHSLEVSLDVSRELAKHKPDGIIFVAESGITNREEIDELRGLGFDAFLIGETLMRSSNIVEEMRRLSE